MSTATASEAESDAWSDVDSELELGAESGLETQSEVASDLASEDEDSGLAQVDNKTEEATSCDKATPEANNDGTALT